MAISLFRIIFFQKLWPDFNLKDLKKIITKYKRIKRNFGEEYDISLLKKKSFNFIIFIAFIDIFNI